MSSYRRTPRRRSSASPLRRIVLAFCVLAAAGLLWNVRCDKPAADLAQPGSEEVTFDLVDVPSEQPAAEPGKTVAEEPADETGPAAAMRAAINAARRKAGLKPLSRNHILQAKAQRGARTIAEAVEKNPRRPQPPDQLGLEDVRTMLPGAAKTSLEAVGTGSAAQLTDKAAHCAAAGDRDVTDLGVGVCSGSLVGGRRFWVAVVASSKIVPPISPELLNQGGREACMECYHCGQQYLARAPEPSAKRAGNLNLTCPRCHRLVDLYGVDASQRYHRPPWFLRGFQPGAIKSPLTAWLFVLNTCRYVDDLKQHGHPEVWQLARQTYRLRRGDCEDTSILLADWLASCGYKARVVIGEEGGSGHAWVVVRGGDHDYVLETTGGRGNYRRVPPRSTLSTSYVPHAQFDRTGVWFRTSEKWTSDYRGTNHWTRGPWPLERVPTEMPNKRG